MVYKNKNLLDGSWPRRLTDQIIRADIYRRILSLSSRASGLELDSADDEVAALDDLDPPRAAGRAGKIRILAHGPAAAVGTAELDGHGLDLEPGRLRDRPDPVGLEGG